MALSWAILGAAILGASSALAGGAEDAVMRGDLALAERAAERGERLPESFSLRPYVGEGDLLRIGIALSLGARVREEDIEVAVIGSQQRVLVRLAEADGDLPPCAWSPRRYREADPAVRQLLSEIRASERKERRASRRDGGGGSRTLTVVHHTILNRARLPVPPHPPAAALYLTRAASASTAALTSSP